MFKFSDGTLIEGQADLVETLKVITQPQLI